MVEPLFTEWCRYACTPQTRSMLRHLLANKARWEQKIAEQESQSPSPAERQGHVNSALKLEEENKENADPSCDFHPSSDDEACGAKFDCQHRRHSLPTDTAAVLPESKQRKTSRRSQRRSSLPNSVLIVPGGGQCCGGGLSRLASLAECSPLSGEFCFDRVLDVRRSSLNDANLSCHGNSALRGKCGPGTGAFRRHSEFAQKTNSAAVMASMLRSLLGVESALYDGRLASTAVNCGANNRVLVANNGSAKSHCFGITKVHSTDWKYGACDEGDIRRLSLAAAEDSSSTRGNANNRKRSSSLVTSSLVCPEPQWGHVKSYHGGHVVSHVASGSARLKDKDSKVSVSAQRCVKPMLTAPSGAHKQIKFCQGESYVK